MRAAILSILLSAVAISADLQSDIDDITSHLPMDHLVLIGQKYATMDTSTLPGLRYIQTLAQHELIGDLVNIKEVHDLVEFLNQRGVDAKGILVHLTKWAIEFNRRVLSKPTAGQLKSGLPSISGNFVADCRDAISKSDVSSVIQEKLKTSDEFGNFAKAVADPEFKRLITQAANSKDFTELCSDCMDLQKRGIWGVIGQIGKEVAVKVAVNVISGWFGK